MAKECCVKLQKWIVNAGNVVVYSFLGIICFYLFLSSIYSTCVIWYDTEKTYYIKDFPILMLLGLLGVTGLGVLMHRLYSRLMSKSNGILVILTLLWFVLITVFVRNTDIDLVYDQRIVYEGTQSFISGNYEMWQQDGYFSWYPFQNGLVLLYTPLMLVFGENTYWAVQGVNVIYYLLLAIGFYGLAKHFFQKGVALVTYAGVLFFLPLWGYVKYLYGNLPGLSLGIWAIYLIVVYMGKEKLRYLLGSAGCIFMAVLYKNNFLIYAIAICLVLIVEAIRQKKLKYVLTVMLLAGIVLVGMKVPSWVMHRITGCITDQGIPSSYWVAMGLRESNVAPGWYNGDSVKLFAENGYSVQRMDKDAWESISDSLMLFRQEKDYALRFFNRKVASIWNNPTFEGFAIVVKGNLHGTLEYWMKDILYSGGIVNTILTVVLDIVQSIYLFGMVLYLMYCRKQHELRKAIPLVAFIGGFIFHIFWEAKCQYTIIFFVLLIPYAFEGYRQCANNVCNWLNKKEKVTHLMKKKGIWAFGVLLAFIFLIAVWDNTFFSSTIKLEGEEGDYVWLCREQDYWKNDNFTKEGSRE